MLNNDTKIRVKNIFGLTQIAAIVENVTQGSIRDAIVSSINLSKTRENISRELIRLLA